MIAERVYTPSNVHSDEHLAHWAEQFQTAGLQDVMTFEQFMDLTPGRRRARLDQHLAAQREGEQLEDDVPHATRHGDALIAPMCERPKKRGPWWFNRNRRSQ